MVKVLLLKQLFDGQQVVGLNNQEPVEIATWNELFIVATKGGSIFVYQARGEERIEHVLLHSFRTVNSTIVALEYISGRDVIATLEKESEKSVINVARLYWNWRKGGGGLLWTEINNGRSVSEGGMCVEVLPMASSILRMAVCPVTGTLATATTTTISLWNTSQKEKEQEENKAKAEVTRLGIEHMLDVDLGTPTKVMRMAVYGPYLAYCSQNEVHVLSLSVSTTQDKHETAIDKLLVTEQQIPRVQQNAPYGAVEDEYFFECTFDDEDRLTSATQTDIIVPSIETPNYSSQNSPFEILGPLIDTNHVQQVNNEEGYILTSARLILHRRFKNSDSIHSLAMLPSYTLLSNEVPNSSRDIPTLKSLCCFVSCAEHGYLYDIESPRLVTQYTYTGETITSQCSSLLYAVTNSGLEIWTLRTPEFGEVDNYPSPCLIGIQPFIGLQRIVVAGEYILLLSKFSTETVPKTQGNKISFSTPMATSRSNLPRKGAGSFEDLSQTKGFTMGWNLYILHPSPLTTLFEEIISAAATYKESNPSVYVQLVMEAHILLKSKLSTLHNVFRSARSATLSPESKGSVLAANSEAKKYHHLLRRSATLLAEHYFEANEFSRACDFYCVSDQKLSHVVDKMLKPQTEGATKTLIQYLNKALFDKTMRDLMDQDKELADRIVAYYQQHSQGNLCPVIFDSCLNCYSTDKALGYLDKMQLSSRYKFEKGILCWTAGKQKQAVHQLLQIDPQRFVEYFATKIQVAYLDTKAWQISSPSIVSLLQVLRIYTPWNVLEVLTLIASSTLETHSHSLSLDSVWHILKKDKSALETGLSTEIPEKVEDELLLMCYLESALLEGNKKEGIERLAELYVSHLEVEDVTKLGLLEREKTTSPFGTKWTISHQKAFTKHHKLWFECIPPFLDPSVQPQSERALRRTASNPFKTNGIAFDYDHFYLRKLLGLLSSSTLSEGKSEKSASGVVLSKLPASGQVDTLSVRVLALTLHQQLEESINLLVNSYPGQVVEFATSYCKNERDWGVVLESLLNSFTRMSSTDANNPLRDQIRQAYEDALSHLSRACSPSSFLKLLPSSGNVSFFNPFLQNCIRFHKAGILKQIVKESVVVLSSKEQ